MSINIDNIIPIPKVLSTNLPQWATLIGKLDCYSEILNQEILPAFVESKVQILETNSLEYAAKLGNIYPIRNKIEEFSTCSRHKVVSVLTVDNIPISFGFTNSLLNGNNCSTLAKVYNELGVDDEYYRNHVHSEIRDTENHAEQMAIAGAYEKIEFLLDAEFEQVKPIHVVLYSSHFTCKSCANRFISLVNQLRQSYRNRVDFSFELIFDQFWANEFGSIKETLDMYKNSQICVTLLK